MSHLKWLLLIVAAGFALRLAAINLIPPSLNWDEVSLGYNAYSLLKTGRDEWGTVLPTIFRAYGDYKLPIYIYLATLSPFFCPSTLNYFWYTAHCHCLSLGSPDVLAVCWLNSGIISGYFSLDLVDIPHRPGGQRGSFAHSHRSLLFIVS